MKLKRLHQFRQNIYDQMGTAKDAVFELMDAAILTRSPSCLAELSLSSVFRRQWHSTPLSHERITSNDTPIQKVAAQLQDICPLLTQRAIVLFDSQYGNAKLLLAIAILVCDKLMRLRSNQCVWGQPSDYSGRGRPKKHGLGDNWDFTSQLQAPNAFRAINLN